MNKNNNMPGFIFLCYVSCSTYNLKREELVNKLTGLEFLHSICIYEKNKISDSLRTVKGDKYVRLMN